MYKLTHKKNYKKHSQLKKLHKSKKNIAYWRHIISQPIRIVAPTFFCFRWPLCAFFVHKKVWDFGWKSRRGLTKSKSLSHICLFAGNICLNRGQIKTFKTCLNSSKSMNFKKKIIHKLQMSWGGGGGV